MKKSDLASIKLGGPAFDRKWWDERRGVLAGGCGVGKSIDVFSKLYQEEPEEISDPGEVETLKKAIGELRAALEKAKKRTGKLDKDTTAACEAYLDIINAYEKKLGLKITEDDDDEKIWKQILVAMPKSINEMSKMTKEMEKSIKQLSKYKETAELLHTRAIARNQLPLSGASRKDLEHAHELLQKAIGEIDEFANRKAVLGTRIADEVIGLEKKLRTRKYDKDMRAFREMVVDIGQAEGRLRDALTDTVNLSNKARDAIAQTQKTVDRVRDMVETKSTMFWDSPTGGATELRKTIEEIQARAQKILDADFDSMEEKEKRKLSAEMRAIDDDRLQLDSNVTNMGNIVRTVVSDTKDFTKDKEIAKFLKEMLIEYKSLSTEVVKTQSLVTAASKKIAEMG